MAEKAQGLYFVHGNLKKILPETHKSVITNVQCLNSKSKHERLLTSAHEITVEDPSL